MVNEVILKTGEVIMFIDKEGVEYTAVIKKIDTSTNQCGVTSSCIQLAVRNGEKYMQITHRDTALQYNKGEANE